MPDDFNLSVWECGKREGVDALDINSLNNTALYARQYLLRYPQEGVEKVSEHAAQFNACAGCSA